MVKYIFKSSNLLNEMKSSLSDLIGSFDDAAVLQTIAENFSNKRDFKSSEEVYKRIMELDPQNDQAKRKLYHFIAMRDPTKVKYEDLPPISLITEYEKLRSIEIDYLKYKTTVTKATSGPVSEITKAIKKTKKKKMYIKWPKNFDPRNPGQAPDPERWIPKLERVKYAKLAKKKGLPTGTQGSSTINTTETRNVFKTGPSTASKGVVEDKKKTTKRK